MIFIPMNFPLDTNNITLLKQAATLIFLLFYHWHAQGSLWFYESSIMALHYDASVVKMLFWPSIKAREFSIVKCWILSPLFKSNNINLITLKSFNLITLKDVSLSMLLDCLKISGLSQIFLNFFDYNIFFTKTENESEDFSSNG